MADVILAEWSTHAWLVRGEEHIDDLLNGTLPPHVSIEVVVCQSKLAIDAMYLENGGENPTDMWLIHPGIVRRSRGLAETMVVQFAEWSAALDQHAHDTIKAAAALAGRKPGMLVLISHRAADAAQMTTGLADIRSGLIEAQLVSLDVDVARLARDTTLSEDKSQADRVELVLREIVAPAS